MKNIEWEDLEEYGMTQRLKVPRGWLVKVRYVDNTTNSLCFFPDSNHEWLKND
jgi:hypothetical protein